MKQFIEMLDRYERALESGDTDMQAMISEDLREFLRTNDREGNPKKEGELIAKIMEVIDNVNGGCDLAAAVNDKDAQNWYRAYKQHQEQKEKRGIGFYWGF
ncbi:hypothetical protein [Helicobacter suis]|uniref:hypothetical protein n=1 Tax=Helicobacter suis TaxID=104628 RepID=UPI0013D5E4E6|nr:hypothetical protein [Helicobacter suis]